MMRKELQAAFDFGKEKSQKHPNRQRFNQYFTPSCVVEKVLALIPEAEITNIIDPAVGNGAFLRMASKKWSKAKLFGIDIDKNIIQKLSTLDFPNSRFFCSNSLLNQIWKLPEIYKIISTGGFDLVVGNPPFSSWFNRIDSKEILSNFQLARRNGKIINSVGTEILFCELFIKLARKDGFVVIVLPDGILSNPQYHFVREFILKKTKVLQIISLPRNIFKNTSAKTSILILQRDRCKIGDFRKKIQ